MKSKEYEQGWNFSKNKKTISIPLDDNPYSAIEYLEKYIEWSNGYRDYNEYIYNLVFEPKIKKEKEKEELKIKKELEKKEEEKFMKKYKKTKKGKAEEAGQNTLF